MARDTLWQLPVFLFFGSIANGVFLFMAIRDHATSTDVASTRALLALAVAELAWVLPCFLQCLLTLFSDGGLEWWVAGGSATGCDMMGFYSVFASVSGQMLVTQLAYITYSVLVRQQRVSSLMVTVATLVSFALALFVALLPFFGVGSFAFSGEGFCYIDWSNAGQAVIMELVTVPTMALTTYFFVSAALCSDYEDSTDTCVREPPPPPRQWWWLFLLAYVSAWILWIPAAFIGLGSSLQYPAMFPKGFMIAGGVLGHMQALVNPALYGIKWRSWFMGVQVMQLESGDGDDAKKASSVSPLEGNAQASKAVSLV